MLLALLRPRVCAIMVAVLAAFGVAPVVRSAYPLPGCPVGTTTCTFGVDAQAEETTVTLIQTGHAIQDMGDKIVTDGAKDDLDVLLPDSVPLALDFPSAIRNFQSTSERVVSLNGEPKSVTTYLEFVVRDIMKTACQGSPANCQYSEGLEERTYKAVLNGKWTTTFEMDGKHLIPLSLRFRAQ